MRSQFVIASATLSAASLFFGSNAAATPSQGCVAGTTNETCTLLEPGTAETSFVSNLISNGFSDSAWTPGYYVISDPLGGVSDYVVFRDECAPFGVCGYADQAVLYSMDGGSTPDLTGLTQLGGTITEDANGFAQFSPQLNAPEPNVVLTADTFNVFSPPEATPEPITLSVFGAGLAATVAVRRRKKRGA